MSEWKEFRIEDLMTLEYGKSLKDYRNEEGEYDVFGTNGKIGTTDKFLYDEPSLIIGRKGAYREVKYSEEPFYVIDTAFYTVNQFDDIITLFMYYWFKNIDINRMNSGSAIPSTSRDEVYDLKILLPPPSEQKAIASVLSSLDDKIDLLHRQNQTLEAMAETLFRQYFVVEAEDNWEEEPLSGIAEFLNGVACQKYPPENPVEKLPVLKIKELKNGISEKSDWANTDVGDDYIVENGDVIFSWSASLLVKIWDGGTCILNQHLFKVTSDRFPKWFYYLWSKYHLDRFQAIARAKATTMGHIRRKDLDEAMVFYSKDKIKAMNTVFKPIISKIILNNQKITKLENIRDTILPKLIGGEIRVN